MGGRGAGIGSRNKNTAEAQQNSWDYPGIKQRIDRLEKTLENSRSVNTINSVARAARATDEQITRTINDAENGREDVPVNMNALMAYRRRVRQLIRKAKI